jgi:hypothetical protein
MASEFPANVPPCWARDYSGVPLLFSDRLRIRQRLGNTLEDIVFDRETMLVPALSPQHLRLNVERTAGPLIRVVEPLSATDPERLHAFRQEFDTIVAKYFRDNVVHQGYLLTRTHKL